MHPDDILGIRVDKDKFLSQMEILRREGYVVMAIKDIISRISEKKTLPDKSIAITFDDGYRDNIKNAAPILAEFSFRATFFVTLGYVGRVKTSSGRSWQRWECMDQKDLKELPDSGHDIGSHSVRHIDLTKLDEKERVRELRNSKKGIGELLGKDISLFSYPYGCFDDDLAMLAAGEGYALACTTISGYNDRDTDPFKLKRVEIASSDTGDSFMEKIG